MSMKKKITCNGILMNLFHKKEIKASNSLQRSKNKNAKVGSATIYALIDAKTFITWKTIGGRECKRRRNKKEDGPAAGGMPQVLGAAVLLLLAGLRWAVVLQRHFSHRR